MADIRISQLPTAPSAITGTELVPIVQNGLTVQTTVAAITQSPSLTQPFLTVGQQPLLPNSRYFSAGIGLGITDGGAQGAYTISFNGTAYSLELASAGVIVKTAANTIAARTFATSGNGISVTDGDGIAGNPTFQLTGIAQAIANATGTGLLALNGSSTISPVMITGTGNQIGVTGGDGSTTPTISLAANFIAPGTAGITLPNGTTAQRGATTGQIRYNTTTARFEGYYAGSWQTFGIGDGAVTSVSGTTSQIDVTNVGSIAMVAIAANPTLPGTAGVVIPVGTTAQRTASPTNGILRYNTTLAQFEAYTNSAWSVLSTGSTGVTSVATGVGLLGGPITTAGTIDIDTTVVATLTGTQTLTNKTISGATNTLTNIANASLTNSAITINGSAVSLGGSTTVTATATNPLTIGTGLSGTSYNGSTAVTVAVANTAVTAASYGSASSAATFTVNAQGQLTAAASTPIAITNAAVSGLGTLSTQNANAVAITGGTINGATVGATTVAAGSFTTLNSSGNTRLGGLLGNQSLQVNNVASGVNYIQITGGATGGGTVISSQGTDTNIPIDYRVKAGGYHAFTTDSGNAGQFLITHTASAVNQARITGSAAGSAVTISTQGSDTNIGFAITTKNTGGIQFRSGNGLQAFVSDTASAVNYLQLTGAATGAAPTLSAAGSETNINLAFATKGTGGHTFSTGGGQQFAVTNIASAVNYLQAQGAPTGSSVGLSVQGTDANISIGYFGKGTGFHFFYTNGIAQASISPTASAVNRVNLTGAATGGAASVSASGSDSNASLALFGQNAGVVALAGSTITNAAAVFVPTAFVANYFQVKASVTTGAPEIAVIGSDANINLNLTPKGTGSVTINATTAITVPAGTTAQRPTGATGMFRYNSTTAGFEGYNGTVWGAIGGGSNITTLGLWENASVIAANYTIGTGNNATSAGPITINSGVVVTVPSGSTWVVV